jgi:hypothetical protein
MLMTTNISDLPEPTSFVPPTQIPLPSRDIPQETIQHTIDAQTIPNTIHNRVHFAPLPPSHSVTKTEVNDEMKTPILLMTLYFLFQLPLSNQFLGRMLPDLFKGDGNLTSGGIVVKSIMFAAAYVAVTKLIAYLSICD